MSELPPCPIPGAELRRLSAADAGQVTVLQRCAWVEEAIVNGSLAIPALTETVAQVAAWLDELEAWGLWLDGRLLGMVRARLAGETWEIGRLAVVPDLRGRGVGHWLLDHIEAEAAPQVREYELFTGVRSTKNIRAYQSRGYVLTGGGPTGVVVLRKPAAVSPPAAADGGGTVPRP